MRKEQASIILRVCRVLKYYWAMSRRHHTLSPSRGSASIKGVPGPVWWGCAGHVGRRRLGTTVCCFKCSQCRERRKLISIGVHCAGVEAEMSEIRNKKSCKNCLHSWGWWEKVMFFVMWTLSGHFIGSAFTAWCNLLCRSLLLWRSSFCLTVVVSVLIWSYLTALRSLLLTYISREEYWRCLSE